MSVNGPYISRCAALTVVMLAAFLKYLCYFRRWWCWGDPWQTQRMTLLISWSTEEWLWNCTVAWALASTLSLPSGLPTALPAPSSLVSDLNNICPLIEHLKTVPFRPSPSTPTPKTPYAWSLKTIVIVDRFYCFNWWIYTHVWVFFSSLIRMVNILHSLSFE